MRAPFLIVALMLAPGVAQAASAEMPQRKSGLWEIKMSSPQIPPHTIQQCVDQKSDELVRNQAQEKMACAKNEIRREGDKLVADSVCKVGGSTVTTRTVFTGRFDSNYKADIKSTFDPPMHGMSESSSTLDARWVGACLAGQKPGDIIMPGMPPGMPHNLQDMQKGMPPSGR